MNSTAQQSRPEMHAAAAVDPAEDNHIIYRGQVISVGDRVITSSYTGKYGGHTEVHGIPEIWLITPAGRELRFCDETLRECRAEHDLEIIGNLKRDCILAVRNASTGGVTYSSVMNDATPLGVLGTGCVVICFCCISWFVSMLLFGEPRRHDTFFQEAGRVAMFWGSIHAGWWVPRTFRRLYNAKAKAHRERLLTLLNR